MSLIGSVTATFIPPANTGGNGSTNGTNQPDGNNDNVGTTETGQDTTTTTETNTNTESGTNSGTSNNENSSNTNDTGSSTDTSSSQISTSTNSADTVQKFGTANTASITVIENASNIQNYEAQNANVSEAQYRAAAEATANSISLEAILFESFNAPSTALDLISSASTPLTDAQNNSFQSLYGSSKLTTEAQATIDESA